MRSPFVLVAMLGVGCGGVQSFEATSRATATSPRGDVASEYDVTSAGGDVIAEAKVWARGAYESRVDGREMTVIEVVFELENDGPAPITLMDVVLDTARVSGVSLGDVRPVRIDGATEVPPSGESRVRAYFAIPQRYDPEDIARFDVAWRLHHVEGTYAERTHFQQPPRYYGSFYRYPYPYPAPFAYMPPDATVMPPP